MWGVHTSQTAAEGTMVGAVHSIGADNLPYHSLHLFVDTLS